MWIFQYAYHNIFNLNYKILFLDKSPGLAIPEVNCFRQELYIFSLSLTIVDHQLLEVDQILEVIVDNWQSTNMKHF